MRKEFEAFMKVIEAAEKPDFIKVWPYEDAPKELQALSPHGGDEDWVAWVPTNMADRYIPWMECSGGFGCCDVSTHPLPDGSIVRIGAHA